MTNLTPPRAGGRMLLIPTSKGGLAVKRLPLEDPLEGATDGEREFYLANYQGVPMAELLRRLRTAEWNEAHYRREAEALRAAQAKMPPLHLIQEMAARYKRVCALLDVPRRRLIPKAELQAIIDGRVEETPAADDLLFRNADLTSPATAPSI